MFFKHPMSGKFKKKLDLKFSKRNQILKRFWNSKSIAFLHISLPSLVKKFNHREYGGL